MCLYVLAALGFLCLLTALVGSAVALFVWVAKRARPGDLGPVFPPGNGTVSLGASDVASLPLPLGMCVAVVFAAVAVLCIVVCVAGRFILLRRRGRSRSGERQPLLA